GKLSKAVREPVGEREHGDERDRKCHRRDEQVVPDELTPRLFHESGRHAEAQVSSRRRTISDGHFGIEAPLGNHGWVSHRAIRGGAGARPPRPNPPRRSACPRHRTARNKKGLRRAALARKPPQCPPDPPGVVALRASHSVTVSAPPAVPAPARSTARP